MSKVGTALAIMIGVSLLLFGSTMFFAWAWGEEVRHSNKFNTAVKPPELDWDWDYTRERGWIEDADVEIED